MYLGSGDDFKLTDCDDACGLKILHARLHHRRQDGNGKDVTYHKEPAWDGRIPMDQNLYQDQIDAIRKRAGT